MSREECCYLQAVQMFIDFYLDYTSSNSIKYEELEDGSITLALGSSNHRRDRKIYDRKYNLQLYRFDSWYEFAKFCYDSLAYYKGINLIKNKQINELKEEMFELMRSAGEQNCLWGE